MFQFQQSLTRWHVIATIGTFDIPGSRYLAGLKSRIWLSLLFITPYCISDSHGETNHHKFIIRDRLIRWIEFYFNYGDGHGR